MHKLILIVKSMSGRDARTMGIYPIGTHNLRNNVLGGSIGVIKMLIIYFYFY